jgi:outer membrane immunogenic protein
MGGVMKKFILGSVALAAMISGSAMAADMPVKAPYSAPPPVLAYDWSGFYIGAHLGYDWESVNGYGFHTDTGALGSTFVRKFPNVFAGFQAGYNYMVAPNILLGVETDLSRNNAGAWGLGTNDGAYGQGVLDWSGTVRGRIGYTANNVLFYGTGGFAWSDVNLTRVQISAFNPVVPQATVDNVSATRTGWTAGAGIEVGVMPNLTVKAEYRYIDYSTFTVVLPLSNRTWVVGTRSEEVLLGANYKFNWGAPLAARY